MGGTCLRNRTYPYNCPSDEVPRTEAGENEMTDMKTFLPVADADCQWKHFQYQGHLKVAWEKQDNREGEMDLGKDK